jgi:hypothetical protein
MLLAIKIVIFIFVSISISQATPCQNKSARLDAKPGPDFMAKIPVTDQGSLGICYAHASAQMIDYIRLQNGDKNTNHFTSPIDLSIRAKNNLVDIIFGNNSINGGSICNTIKNIKVSCNSDDFDRQLKNFDSKFKSYRSPEEVFLKDLTNFYAENQKLSMEIDDLSWDDSYIDDDRLEMLEAQQVDNTTQLTCLLKMNIVSEELHIMEKKY